MVSSEFIANFPEKGILVLLKYAPSIMTLDGQIHKSKQFQNVPRALIADILTVPLAKTILRSGNAAILSLVCVGAKCASSSFCILLFQNLLILNILKQSTRNKYTLLNIFYVTF